MQIHFHFQNFTSLLLLFCFCLRIIDQVLAEKEEATEVARNATRENEQLKREVEGLRDETEELKDRLGNFKVHAQAKEVSVCVCVCVCV